MNQFEKITYEDIRKVFTLQKLKELQIVYLALGFGVFIFTIILFFIYTTISGMVVSTDDSQILIMTIIHLILLSSSFPLSKFLFINIIRGRWAAKLVSQDSGLHKDGVHLEPAKAFWDRIRTAHIIRLALYEGIALFGLVTCSLAVFNGVLQSYPIYWINMISSFIFIMILAYNFPSSEKMESFFREYVQAQSYRLSEKVNENL
jgi:hypothetical protein